MIRIKYTHNPKSRFYYKELKNALSSSAKFQFVDNPKDGDFFVLGPEFLSESMLRNRLNINFNDIESPKVLFLNKEYKNLKEKLKFINANKIEYVFTVHQDYKKWNKECAHSKFFKIPFAYNPDVFQDYGAEKTIDIGFTGNLFNDSIYRDTPIMGTNYNNIRERMFNKLKEEQFNKYNKFLQDGDWNDMPQEKEYGALINSSKIWLCTPSAIDIVGSRFYEILGSNALLFCKNIGNIYEGLFEDTVHYVGFSDDLTDFAEKLHHYLNNEEERKRITLNGFNHAKNNHTWKHRVDSIYSVLKGQI